MQRRKLGIAVVWMVCLLGMVAVVWSRPPMGSRESEHPRLALTAPEDPAPLPQPASAQAPPPVEGNPIAHQSAPAAWPLSSTPLPALPPSQWVHETKWMKISLTFEGHRLQATLSGRPYGEHSATCRISADYHLTQDSILYGVITSAEGAGASDPEDASEATGAASVLFDQPFALRYRLDAEALTIKDVKLGPLVKDPELMDRLVKAIVGRYQPPKSESPQ